jgi:hypothetical protein
MVCPWLPDAGNVFGRMEVVLGMMVDRLILCRDERSACNG